MKAVGDRMTAHLQCHHGALRSIWLFCTRAAVINADPRKAMKLRVDIKRGIKATCLFGKPGLCGIIEFRCRGIVQKALTALVRSTPLEAPCLKAVVCTYLPNASCTCLRSSEMMPLVRLRRAR